MQTIHNVNNRYLNYQHSFVALGLGILIFITYSLIGQSYAEASSPDQYPGAVSLTHNSWANPGSLYYIHSGNDVYACSVGFPAADNAGNHYFITAGHCGDVGDQIYTDNGQGPSATGNGENLLDALKDLNNPFINNILGLEGNSNGNSDNPLQKLFSGIIFGPPVNPTVTLYEQGKFVAKIGRVAHGSVIDLAVVKLFPGGHIPGGFTQVPNVIQPATRGTPICKLGSTSGRTCGVIVANNQTIKPENYEYSEVGDFARMCVISGDSGGPVYSRTGAIGIVSAGEDVENCKGRNRDAMSIVVDLQQGMPYLQHDIPGLHLI